MSSSILVNMKSVIALSSLVLLAMVGVSHAQGTPFTNGDNNQQGGFGGGAPPPQQAPLDPTMLMMMVGTSKILFDRF